MVVDMVLNDLSEHYGVLCPARRDGSGIVNGVVVADSDGCKWCGFGGGRRGCCGGGGVRRGCCGGGVRRGSCGSGGGSGFRRGCLVVVVSDGVAVGSMAAEIAPSRPA
ncbi:hypothetical protein Pmani_000733 [Petrolisthes manimaculis]|uniref:Uncharacterized protein n=1 Tax=Petrolisthes manimaculis TaxID=1843537 RepID=A0AAE1QLV8_9EUCA|nr:hypothetical protein Pmani_000733 [Petrolisthes manimaculis]